MALPLKSGADLYNQQLIRAAIWNNSADVLDPKEYATGLMYFNTNPSSNMYQKLRFRTGTDWKTIAFAEDLDVATNKDFKALKERVDAFLDGEVDSNGVLDNLKEIQKFLDNYSSATDLTDILNTKFDKSGGTIQGYNEAGTADTPLIVKSANRIYTAISLQTPEKEAINLRWYDQYGAILANSSASTWLVLGEDKSLYYTTDGAATKHILLHSGNIYEKNLGLNEFSTFRFFTASGDSLAPKNESIISGFTVAIDGNNSFKKQLAFGHDSQPRLYARSQDTGSWSEWKQIAFLDDNVASAQALVHSNGRVGATVRNNGIISISEYLILKNSRYCVATLSDGTTERNILGINSDNKLLVGYGSRWDGKTLIYGDGIECIIKDTPAMLINSSGNVTIGGSDFAGTDYKLYVEGGVKVLRGLRTTNLAIECDENGGQTGYYSEINHVKGGNLCLQVRQGDLIFSHANGATTIRGTLSVAGNTTINNNLTVSNNIVANGTIACKGVAAEGSAPVGTVDKWAGSIATGTKSQTYTHALGTTDITVAIYEKNGNEWVQILTDVDIVNANTIRVTFGANTTVEHRIVVMG